MLYSTACSSPLRSMRCSASGNWSRPFFDSSIFHNPDSLSPTLAKQGNTSYHYPTLNHKFIGMKAMLFFENDDMKEKLKSTGSSLFFRATGRQTKPVWGNRIVKDFYDLDYDVKNDMAKFNENFKSSDVKKLARIRADIKKSKFARHKIILENNSELLSDRKKTLQLREKEHKHRWHNPQTIQVGALLASSSKTQGLCPFEFRNTIQGRMQTRRNLHISYDRNKSSRISNEYPIFYDRDRELDFSHSKMMEERRLMKTYHPFNSYSERKVFEPKNELDKVFDTENARSIATPKRTPAAVRHFQKTIKRMQPKISESMILTYDTMPSILHLKKKSSSYSIQRSQRNTSFSPEVISDRRGCKR